MNSSKNQLRSFVDNAGKLVLCNESFFAHFGHSQQYLIGRFVTDIFAACEPAKIVGAMNYCQRHPGESCTLEVCKDSQTNPQTLRFTLCCMQQNGKSTGVQLEADVIDPAEVFLHQPEYSL